MTVQKLFCSVCIFVCAFFICEGQGYNLTISTKNGYVQGYKQQSHANSSFSFYYFKGIPYAEPPLGSLRFQEPVAVSSWKKVLDAKEFAKMCSMPSTDGSPTISGNEDCLYLNIYVPAVENAENETLSLPVMVFIHGGAFLRGDSYPDPSYILEGEVIVVTIAYRLGIFGFLSVEDENAWGNAGLKDQRLALKWINENIEYFGGDPNKITIFGQSAGGASVEYQLLSPTSSGLFSQAIIESGSTLNVWALQRNPKNLTLEYAKLFNITFEDTGKVVEALQNISYEYLLTKSWDLVTKFLPIIEPEHPGAFINRSTYEIWSEGAFNKVPVIIGYNSEDGSYGGSSCAVFNNYHETIIPYGLQNDLNPEETQEVVEKIAERYFPNNSYLNFTRCINYSTQETIVRGVRKNVADLKKSPAPVYLYKFEYVTEMNYTYGVNGGAGHGEELLYLWHSWDNPLANDIDRLMKTRLVTLWTNFAKFGNPTPKPSPILDGVEWPTIQNSTKEDDVSYLLFGRELEIGQNPDQDDYLFWKDLFKNYSKSTIYIY